LPMNNATSSDLERGREHYAQRAWADAYRTLILADEADAAGLAGEDLELLATSAYLIGRDEEYLRVLGRGYDVYLGRDETIGAARCAFWLGLRLFFRGEMGQANGWFARAQRLLDRLGHDCVERGHLLLPVAQQHLFAGDCETAFEVAARAIEVGERFSEASVVAAAVHLQGHVRLHQGRIAEGLALFDEAMVAVSSGKLVPIIAGLLYCSIIEACQEVYAWQRSREWTLALTQWWKEQPQLVAFTGLCLVHRAEILHQHGAWANAIEEAQRACERCAQASNRAATAAAFYQEGEVHRLRGEFSEAEEAYRRASGWGRDPQPGHALLQLAQGRTEAALAAIRRVLMATSDMVRRTRVLPAAVEIMIAVGEIQEAREACSELEQIAERFGSEVLNAIAAQARGEIEVAEDNPRAAMPFLLRALSVWQNVDAPYHEACVRLSLGLACRAVGDDDGARLELNASKATFERLGAVPGLDRGKTLFVRAGPDGPHRLTPRELQVLRLVASGKTNKAIAAELLLSEKTVDRHVSNIFIKLDVPSRTAATAFAYQSKLM
jgi:ATP/maltotriose-dependent transcriptional regulator MalT